MTTPTRFNDVALPTVDEEIWRYSRIGELDLAPDAPWRCPDACPKYERRLADAAWVHGSVIAPRTPAEPPGLDDGSAAAVLDAAEDIVNAAGFDLMEELAKDAKRRWWKFRRKK